MRRHEVLRTTLVADNGIPRQVIAASVGLTLEIEDLSGLPEDERQTHATARICEEAQRPFDLARGPLIRARLLRLGEQEYIAVMIMHHAISDGWSIGILIREVSALYESSLKAESSPLPELAIQYADFAVWQRNWLKRAILDTQLGYWTNNSRTPELNLPTDRPRPLVPSQHRLRDGRQRCRRRLWSGASAQDDSQAARALFMTLLAAYQLDAVPRTATRRSFAVGSPIAGRTHPASWKA